MKVFFALAATLLALCMPSSAEVTNGDKYKCGPNGTVTVSITVDIATNVAHITVSRGNNTSNTATATPGASSSQAAPTAEDSAECRLDHDGDPTTGDLVTRVHDGKFQYQNANGDWINAGCPRKKDRAGPHGGNIPMESATTGEEVTSLPITGDRPRVLRV